MKYSHCGSLRKVRLEPYTSINTKFSLIVRWGVKGNPDKFEIQEHRDVGLAFPAHYREAASLKRFRNVCTGCLGQWNWELWVTVPKGKKKKKKQDNFHASTVAYKEANWRWPVVGSGTWLWLMGTNEQMGIRTTWKTPRCKDYSGQSPFPMPWQYIISLSLDWTLKEKQG